MTDILRGLHDDLPARCYHRSECLRDDRWPAYPEDIRELELPGWARVVRVR